MAKVVSVLDLQFGDPGFKFRSGHLWDLFLVIPRSNPPGVLNPVMLYLNYLFFKYLSGVPVN